MEIYKEKRGSGRVLLTESRGLYDHQSNKSSNVVCLLTDDEGNDCAMLFEDFTRKYELDWEVPSVGSLYIQLDGTILQVTEVDRKDTNVTAVRFRTFPLKTPKNDTYYSGEYFKEKCRPFKAEKGQAWAMGTSLFRVAAATTDRVRLTNSKLEEALDLDYNELLEKFTYLIE